MLYRYSKIWLVSSGCVVGFDLEYINNRIGEYNRFYYKFSDFFSWLSYEENQYFSGFDVLWNDRNPLFSKLIKIRKQEV